MTWVALVAWLATAVGGFTLGTQWISRGGAKDDRGIGIARLGLHAALAVGGLVLWIVYAFTGEKAFGWLALGALVLVIAIGLWMFAIWLRGRSPRDRRTDLPAETAFPVPVVLGHGFLAMTTVLLALLALLA